MSAAAQSWHVYLMGEELEVEVDGVWKRARFIDETMSPSHKGIVELLDGGERFETWRERLRPVGAIRGRVT